MSRPIWSAGISSAGTTRLAASRRRPELGGDHDVGRQHDLARRLLGPLEVAPAGVDLVLLEQALADLVALGLEEGEHHAAADQQPVGLAEQVVDDAELVGDLGAAEHHDVGPLRVLGEPAQHVDLGGDQAAHGVRQPLRDVVHEACLRCTTPKPSETKASASAASWSANAPRSASSLLVSPALNRTFSSTRDLAVLEAVDGRPGALADGVGRRTRRRLAEQLAEPGGHRAQRVRRVRRALGPAEVGGHDDPGAGRRPAPGWSARSRGSGRRR